MPIFYVDSLLKLIGINATWDGNSKTWTISSPTAASSLWIDAKSGPTTVIVNGTEVENRVPTAILRDPSSGGYTTFMPIWFVQQMLNSVGFTPSTDKWNGASSTPTWSLASSDSTVSNSIPGYILNSSTSVNFIQLTISGNMIQGSWQQTSIDSTGIILDNYHYNITGVSSGNNVTLDIPPYGEVSGTLTSSGLTLSLPQSDGSLSSVTFTLGSSATFNSDVTAFTENFTNSGIVASNNQQFSDDLQQLQQDKNQVGGDLGSLTNAVQSAPGYISDEAKWMSVIQQDEQTVLNDVKSGINTYNDMQKFQNDAQELGLDDSAIQQDYTSTMPYVLGQLNNDIQIYQADYTKLLADAKNVSPNSTSGIPTQASITDYVKSVQTSAADTMPQMKPYATQSAATWAQALQDYQTALNASKGIQGSLNGTTSTTPQTAPPLQVSLTPGTTPGTMQLSFPVGFWAEIEYVPVNSPSTPPNVGDTPPSAASPYNIYGGEISMIGSSAKYIDIYELTQNATVAAFTELPISSSNISPTK